MYPIHGVNDGGEVLIWGVQLESNAYATSYIPTYGSTATRAADVSSSSSNTFGNSFYNQTEGTVFNGWRTFGDTNNAIFMVSDGTSANYLYNWIDGSILIRFRIRNNSVNVFDKQPATVSLNSFYQTSFTYSAGNNAVVINGGSVVTGTGSSALALSQLDIGNASFTSAPLNGTLYRLTVWPTRLSNDTLKTITA